MKYPCLEAKQDIKHTPQEEGMSKHPIAKHYRTLRARLKPKYVSDKLLLTAKRRSTCNSRV